MIYEKKIKIKISARFGQFLISSWMEKGHEPSRAELKIFQLGSDSSLIFEIHIGCPYELNKTFISFISFEQPKYLFATYILFIYFLSIFTR